MTRGEDGDWSTYDRTLSGSRQSPLTQINAANIGQLKPAWHVDLTDGAGRVFEATPLVVYGVMYLTTAYSVVFAFDAANGRELWRYDPQVAKDFIRKGCCGPASRGVAIANGVVFTATYDGRLIALDADTGKVRWSSVTVDQSKDYTITGAPRVVGDLVLIGNAGAELNVRGYISAYHRDTGALAWRFFTVPPRPGTHDGAASDAVWARFGSTWAGEWWKYGGGGTVWDSIAYDPNLKLIYVGVGNGASWNRQLRADGKGDNLFLSSILALHADTGAYAWHFQTTPGDEWDYTATQSIVLADLAIRGTRRKVLIQAPKNGFFYVLDRATGQFISGSKYVPVSWATGLDPGTGRPRIVDSARYSENGKPSLQLPGPFGGHNWQPMSFSQRTGLAYIPAINAGFDYAAAGPDYKMTPATPNMGIDPLKTALPTDERAIADIRRGTFGELVAWDPVRQRAAWRVRKSVPWNGGTMVTDADLVFQGDAQGKFSAYDARSGKLLWSMDVGVGIVAAPMTYRIGREQYVAIGAGWGGAFPLVAGALTKGATNNRANRLIVFKLGGTDTLPAIAPIAVETPASGGDASTADAAAGHGVYERQCASCHGSAAVSGGELPDLRYSGAIGSREGFAQIVGAGALASNGMPAFGQKLTPDELEQVRAFLMQRATEAKKP